MAENEVGSGDNGQQLGRSAIVDMVLRTFGQVRWTQDSPIVPDVWIEYVQKEERAARLRVENKGPHAWAKVDLLLTPWTGAVPGLIALKIRSSLGVSGDIAPGSSRVAVSASFDEMVSAVLPLTGWWLTWQERRLRKPVYEPAWLVVDDNNKMTDDLRREAIQLEWLRFEALAGFIVLLHYAEDAGELDRLVEMATRIGARARSPTGSDEHPERLLQKGELRQLIAAFKRLLDDAFGDGKDGLKVPDKAASDVRVWMVNLNRSASVTVFDSRKTVKADAAQKVFETGGAGISVAVVDVGIDATHIGFLDRGSETVQARLKLKNVKGERFPLKKLSESSRVKETYDFALLRDLMAKSANGKLEVDDIKPDRTTLSRSQIRRSLNHLEIRARVGRGIDWELVAPLIQIPHNEHYRLPALDHGTHVAGIVAADLPLPNTADMPIKGMCPQATLYDLRVFDDQGASTEYAILAAIEFVDWLNRNRKEPEIHAVNLSLALAHDVDSFACGRTPICDACNQLVGAGTVVVAAAGNTGFDGVEKQSMGTGYRTISITDPGNAEDVITVGSTHRRDPHSYGVSYFSSRGPTGDGRRKPDLLAPGEKITSTVRNNQTDRLDGTSMAAPHVTGAAALIMSRYPELIGQPRKIKQILMQTATDLGREPSFQGAGLLDILRALQSV